MRSSPPTQGSSGSLSLSAGGDSVRGARCEACNSGLHDVRKQLNEMQVALIRSMPEPGETLFWDLLQDDMRPLLAADLEEKVVQLLIHLLASVNTPCIKYRFICACIENLSRNRSVIVCFRLVPSILNLFLPQNWTKMLSPGGHHPHPVAVAPPHIDITATQRALCEVSENWRDIEANHQVWNKFYRHLQMFAQSLLASLNAMQKQHPQARPTAAHVHNSPLASVYTKFAHEINARLSFITNVMHFSPDLNILLLDASNNNSLWEELLIGLAPFESLFNVVVQWFERELNQLKSHAIVFSQHAAASQHMIAAAVSDASSGALTHSGSSATHTLLPAGHTFPIGLSQQVDLQVRELLMTRLPHIPADSFTQDCLKLYNTLNEMVELSKEQSLALSDYLWDVMLCTDHVDLSTELGRLINNIYSQFGALDQMLDRVFRDLGQPNSGVLCNKQNLTRIERLTNLLRSTIEDSSRPYACLLHFLEQLGCIRLMHPSLQSDSACNCLGGKRFHVPLCIPFENSAAGLAGQPQPPGLMLQQSKHFDTLFDLDPCEQVATVRARVYKWIVDRTQHSLFWSQMQLNPSSVEAFNVAFDIYKNIGNNYTLRFESFATGQALFNASDDASDLVNDRRMLSDTGDVRVVIINRDASTPISNPHISQLANGGYSILSLPIFYGDRVSAHELFLNFLQHIISSNFAEKLCVPAELHQSVAHSLWELLMRLPLPQNQYRCLVNCLRLNDHPDEERLLVHSKNFDILFQEKHVARQLYSLFTIVTILNSTTTSARELLVRNFAVIGLPVIQQLILTTRSSLAATLLRNDRDARALLFAEWQATLLSTAFQLLLEQYTSCAACRALCVDGGASVSSYRCPCLAVHVDSNPSIGPTSLVAACKPDASSKENMSHLRLLNNELLQLVSRDDSMLDALLSLLLLVSNPKLRVATIRSWNSRLYSVNHPNNALLSLRTASEAKLELLHTLFELLASLLFARLGCKLMLFVQQPLPLESAVSQMNPLEFLVRSSGNSFYMALRYLLLDAYDEHFRAEAFNFIGKFLPTPLHAFIRTYVPACKSTTSTSCPTVAVSVCNNSNTIVSQPACDLSAVGIGPELCTGVSSQASASLLVLLRSFLPTASSMLPAILNRQSAEDQSNAGAQIDLLLDPARLSPALSFHPDASSMGSFKKSGGASLFCDFYQTSCKYFEALERVLDAIASNHLHSTAPLAALLQDLLVEVARMLEQRNSYEARYFMSEDSLYDLYHDDVLISLLRIARRIVELRAQTLREQYSQIEMVC